MTQDDVPSPLERARSVDGVDANAALYASWAGDYDHDVFELAGVIGSTRIADLLAEHLPDRSAAVLDLGCGTGAVGVRLHQLGFTHIDGVDLSPEMLAVAGQRSVYRHLAVADLTEPGSARTGSPGPGSSASPGSSRRDMADTLAPSGYDATVAAGVFTTGHLGAPEAAALVGLVRHGGIVAWVVADPLWHSVEAAILGAGVELVYVGHEAIRRDAAPEARMVVGVRVG
jgi:predicted TPR repeat methyltransferase